MHNLTPTACSVNNMWINEQLAKAERYHELTRGDAAVDQKPVDRPAVRMPRLSLISRLFPSRLRTA